MKSKALADVLDRVGSWPAAAQEELASIAREIEAGLSGDAYEPSPDELAGIDRGLRDADQGRFGSEADVEAAFATFRRR
jgi:predicted transcriptional regulator